ncbi:dihydrolipoamide acetyltransferase component of pyruvate dehydrogenase complex [Arthrobacter sp. StoSoilA2]|uniref:dihydrolipoamide acetyltransferase family protein n=1 Tax=Arthrobacter sp. StoSoilA2 TaxID=2830990 RepID=UPI001CC336E8|nr:dihydrolipoamide acetyltransferase family protein [Arthrobacter sp. StoSoilA2]BCW36035.1 dihydrolipoamide acetyltransferase component of pyruvate dehydrogenase complex [Arthrobacter sp. StoSoilA2]
MAVQEFRLPDLGEGLTESEILSWKVAVGDTVELNQVIAEVETAKAVVEIPSPYSGTIAVLHEAPGTVVQVGAPIVSFELDEANEGGESSLPTRVPTLVGYGAEVEKVGRPRRRSRNSNAGTPLQSAAAAADPHSVAPKPAATSVERPRSTPPIRKLARDLKVDLQALVGTGPTGLVTRADVTSAADKDSQAASALASDTNRQNSPAESRTPIKGVRKHTAAAMVASAFTAPHVTEFLTVDVTKTVELLAKLKEAREFSDFKLTPLTLVAKAVLMALARNASLNSRWDEKNQEIIQFNHVNLGIAAATPRGLMVPNIKGADGMSFRELSAALSDLTNTAKAGRTNPSDLSGGTFSITNIGIFVIDAGTPILNPGEAGILALGAIRKLPWEHKGGVALRSLMTLSLSFDHRLVDGEQGSRFLADVGSLLVDPGLALSMG